MLDTGFFMSYPYIYENLIVIINTILSFEDTGFISCQIEPFDCVQPDKIKSNLFW